MYSVFLRATVQNPGLVRHTHGSTRWCRLVTDVVGELADIHPQESRQGRVARLDVLRGRFTRHLAAHSQMLEGSGHASACELQARQTESLAVSALQVILHDGPRLLDHYAPHEPGNDRPTMKPDKAQALQRESLETVQWLLTQGRAGLGLAATYAAAMEPGLHDAFLGAGWRDLRIAYSCPPQTLGQYIDRRQLSPEFAGLPSACMLALRLYAHPASSAFNLVRACADLRRLLPEYPVTLCVDEIPTLVNEAVHRLYDLPSARIRGALYKGMQSRGAGEWAAGMTIAIDRPFSATAIQQQSYAGRIVHGTAYDRELEITDTPAARTRAVMIAAFHPVSTAPQAEAVLLPGQVYRLKDRLVREEPAREGGSVTIVRQVAEKIGDAAPAPQAAALAS